MYGYIYLTTNLINGKKYVGSHQSEEFTESYKGSGTILKKAIKKYGVENFKVELLEECNSAIELVEKEEYWITELDAVESDDFYNLTYSGYKRGLTGYRHSEEAKRKISESERGEKNPWYGKDMSGANNPFYGKRHTEETKEKMSKNHADVSGENNPWYGKRGEEIPWYGRKHTKEELEKMRKWNLGKTLSEETRQKISKANKGRKASAETKEKLSRIRKESGVKPPSPKGKKWITNDIQNKLVLPEEIEFFLSQGYHLGKKKYIKNEVS